jgi:hypothetical protein
MAGRPIMTNLMWVAAVIGVRGSLSLLELRLRLHRQALRQMERNRYILTIVRALPEGSQIDEGQLDGTWLRLTIDRSQTSKSDRG